MNALTTTSPAEVFRSQAQDQMVSVANMTLHELVDEFVRLSEIVDRETTFEADVYKMTVSDAGQLADRQRRMVNAATRSRFGISLDVYDRPGSASMSDW